MVVTTEKANMAAKNLSSKFGGSVNNLDYYTSDTMKNLIGQEHSINSQ